MRKLKTLAYWFILPAALAMLFVHILPMTWGILISFKKLDIFTIRNWISAPWIGFQNYINGFNPVTTVGQRYISSLWNVLYYGVVTILGGFVLSLIAALLLNRDFFGRTLVRGLILIPYITPDAVAFSFWRFMFQNRIGIINETLQNLGIIQDRVMWLVGSNSLYAVMIAAMWKGWPFGALMLLAGLQTIPREMYEAAMIDGASVWQRFRYITMAYLSPVIKTMMIMNILWNFHAYNQFVTLLGSDPGKYAEVPNTLIMRQTFSFFKYGIGSALSVSLMVIMLVITLLYLYIFRIRAEE
ncbi:carbohydrate ABC transporter permease [Iocasia frigidifontis]|nr:sugar ABC transporter permease [Iocasia fonsfrigidae]